VVSGFILELVATTSSAIMKSLTKTFKENPPTVFVAA